MKKTTKAKAKKPAAVKPDNDDRDPLHLVRRFAPTLIEQRATLLPFDDVICGSYAGPQPNAKDYDPDEEPYFTVEIKDPSDNSCSYFFKVTQYGVTYSFGRWPGDGTLELWDVDMPYTMEALWEFMRQVPRPAHVFNK